MKKAKRNIIIAAVLVLVCAAVYLNWSYNASDESEPVDAADDASGAQTVGTQDSTDDYFAQARLARQTSRDEALGLLETAAASEGASQETIDASMDAIAAMATWSMQETQIENLLLAKNFADAVVYISSDGVTVAVPGSGGGAELRRSGADHRDGHRRNGLHRRGHTRHRGQGRRQCVRYLDAGSFPCGQPGAEASDAAGSLDTADTE